MTVVREATHGGDGLLCQVVLRLGIHRVVLEGLTHAVDLLVDLLGSQLEWFTPGTSSSGIRKPIAPPFHQIPREGSGEKQNHEHTS